MSSDLTRPEDDAQVEDKNKSEYRRPARVPSRVQEFIVQESKRVVRVERDLNKATDELPPRKPITPGPELDTRRSYIAKEILNTEQTYVEALQTGVEVYMLPMKTMAKAQQNDSGKDAPLVSLEIVTRIFGNMEALIALNRDLLSKLQARVDEWTPQSTLGDLFKKFAPFFKMYTTYSNNYDAAIDALDEAAVFFHLRFFIRSFFLGSWLA